MRISDVRTLRMGTALNDWNWLFVVIATDASIRGIGEASLQYKDAGLQAEIVDGHTTPPSGPGRGTDIREEGIAAHPPHDCAPVVVRGVYYA